MYDGIKFFSKYEKENRTILGRENRRKKEKKNMKNAKQ